jgi:hypothetical protein
MKKLLVILLLIMYGTSSFGMTVHFHFCCGKLKAVDLTPPKDNHCNSSKSYQIGEKPCCENKQVEIKVSGEQDFAKDFYVPFSPVAIKPVQLDLFFSDPLVGKRLLPEVFAPPPKSSQPLYILNSVFRI